MIEARSFLSSLAWAVVGAALGNLSAEPMARSRDALIQNACGLQEYLAQGRRYRREALILKRGNSSSGSLTIAVEAEVARLHGAANFAFEKARDCGSALALAQLGTAYCHGWSIARDRSKGMAMIQEAAGMSAAVAVEWLHEESYCPGSDLVASQ